METMSSILENYYWDEKNNEWKSFIWFLEKNMNHQAKGEKWVQTNFSEFGHKRNHLDIYIGDDYYEDQI